MDEEKEGRSFWPVLKARITSTRESSLSPGKDLRPGWRRRSERVNAPPAVSTGSSVHMIRFTSPLVRPTFFSSSRI